MVKKLNIDEIRSIVNSIPGHSHSIPPTYHEQSIRGSFYISKDALMERFEEAKS